MAHVMGNRVRQAVSLVHADVLDLVLAAVCLAAMLVERIVSLPTSRMPLAIGFSVVVATGVALRRRAPLAGYVAGSAALTAETLWTTANPISPYANLIGVYSLGLYATRGRARAGLPVVLVGVVLYFAKLPHTVMPAGVLVVWLLAWALGYGAARRHEEQQAARHAIGRAAVADERLRLARELHDLVGHTVNVMVVQAGAGRRVLARDPATAKEILTSLEQVGRDALAELDRMLGLLRNTDPTAEEHCQPAIADLPRLVERMAEVGITVTLTGDPPTLTVPPAIGLAAYRIVQEALTNALTHGGARVATVTLRRTGTDLCIEVHDDGRGAPTGYLPGMGLQGIGERVTALGGSFEHGNGEHGGFRLRAILAVS